MRPTHSPAQALSALLERLPALHTDRPIVDGAVTGCSLDSRTVRPGDLYAALPGAHAHGADYAAQAVAAGAAAVLTDPAGGANLSGCPVPVLLVDDPRSVLGEVASWVYGDPASAMRMFAVTGTNGKTTTVFLLEAGLRAAGHRTGLLGTVLTRIGADVVASVRTTPEAPDLQALLATMRERGATAVAMEVSSHALSLGRVDGVRFDVATFTNLSQDHLDFHPSMTEYEAVKTSLFTPARARAAVLNVDDPAGRRIGRGTALPVTTFGEDADWQVREVDLRADGSAFRLLGPGVDLRTSLRLPGAFNVANAVAALASLGAAGIDVAAAAVGMAELAGVPGRMERVDAGQPFLALVDYAHTPEAVSRLLAAVRAVTSGRLILVLGAGGDRDPAKRPLMGAAASAADLLVLTSDNPRHEDPEAILAALAAGAPDAVLEVDRRAAMALAVRSARAGDAVVVAGKGHETGQEVAGSVLPFDDRQVLRELLRA